MQRLTIHLKNVETKGGKTKNTVTHILSNQKEIEQKLRMYSGRVTKHYLSNIN